MLNKKTDILLFYIQQNNHFNHPLFTNINKKL